MRYIKMRVFTQLAVAQIEIVKWQEGRMDYQSASNCFSVLNQSWFFVPKKR